MSPLDALTIDVARVLEKHGVDGTQYNEIMNNLRFMLQEHIQYADHQNPLAAEKIYSGHTEWFKMWNSSLKCWHER